jgi:hypothetical protein
MRAGILVRIRALERRIGRSEAERLPRLPDWLLKSWEEQGVPIDESGRPDYKAMERIGAEQRAAADSISVGTEERRGPDVTHDQQGSADDLPSADVANGRDPKTESSSPSPIPVRLGLPWSRE